MQRLCSGFTSKVTVCDACAADLGVCGHESHRFRHLCIGFRSKVIVGDICAAYLSVCGHENHHLRRLCSGVRRLCTRTSPFVQRIWVESHRLRWLCSGFRKPRPEGPHRPASARGSQRQITDKSLVTNVLVRSALRPNAQGSVRQYSVDFNRQVNASTSIF